MVEPPSSGAADATPESEPRNGSFWVASTPATDYPALDGDHITDVVVVGAGIRV
jgi:hypothetical protein